MCVCVNIHYMLTLLQALLCFFLPDIKMAALTADWTVQWAGQLADLADQIIQEIPDKEEWGTVRTFVSNMSRMLRQGDVRAGFRAVLRVLPYVQRALSSAEKCSNIHSTFELTKSIYRHFLVDDCHRKNLENLIEGIRSKMSELRRRMEKLTISLDKILDDVICRGESLSWWGVLKLAFEINRISALIKTCEDRLTTVRCLLDDLESHVAAKSFMAYIFTYITFIIGLGKHIKIYQIGMEFDVYNCTFVYSSYHYTFVVCGNFRG